METEDAAFAFAALGQGTRLGLLRVLLDAGPSGVAAGEAATRLGVPSSTLSFHLRALDQAGLRRRLEAFLSLPIVSLGRMALKARLDELADPQAMI